MVLHLTVHFSKIQLNGGAKYLGSAVDCIFNDNRATKQGGAIKDTYVVNCNLTYNTAPQGGAMALNSAVNSLFMFNTADYGGAMYSSYSDTCEFYNNSAKQGGAIYSSGANHLISDLIMRLMVVQRHCLTCLLQYLLATWQMKMEGLIISVLPEGLCF